MDIFHQAPGIVAAVCIGIMALATFFEAVGYFKRRTATHDIVKMKRFVEDGRAVNVHLSSGRVFAGVRFVGFTDRGSATDGIPWPLSQMVVCETVKGARIFLRANAVRVIEEVEDVDQPDRSA